ncbi:alternate-type signal peptide domain-containing protein [Rhodococcus sp. IEGM 1379]|uniref:alternate-type signal peptide domain-containing protein n=1 Tax=Rhodococcus sp. IEGM 1379 TaxID=3047086 RepID=UPI0024B6586E|nr:alternate-type signal peptide domain-containing protein [Rhodococcus sp. IEGM 1379]MDI9917162.1 alternate-type signal peptide domain-containing protein [Rhodococcus sp. IEGM 1379]
MNKTTKGAIAAASAALLLAGGAGTMAAWNASTATTGAGTVTAGSMAVSETSAGTWKWVNGTKAGAAYVPGTDLLVPGDKVSYTSVYAVTLNGTNLKANLTPTLGNLTGSLATTPGLLAVTASNTNVSPITASGPISFTTEVEFKPATAGQVGAGGTATIGAGTIVLEQVITPVTP